MNSVVYIFACLLGRYAFGYNDRKIITYYWTGCVSHLEDCSPDCWNYGNNYETCEYNTWDYCSTIFSKKCKCKCERNVDLSSCFELDIAAYASNGHYYLTKQIYSDKEVYSRRTEDPRYIYWSNSKWYISKTVGGSWFATCTSALLKDCTAGITVSNCKSLWRSDGRCGGSYKSDGFDYQMAVCNAESNYPCCSNGQWCGNTAAHCTCNGCINYQDVERACVLEEVTQPVEFCDITPLDKVDEEIGKQILWNVAGVLAGKLPIVGDIFDVYFAAMDPVSPVTSPFTLINNLIEGVNKQIESLKNCMDQEITNSEVDQLRINFEESLNKADECKSLHNLEKQKCVENLWFDFRPKIVAVFSTKETGSKTYLKYQKMIPIYQSVYPLFMGTLAARLGYLQDAGDGCNFNPTLQLGIQAMNVLHTWIGWALEDIVDELTPNNGWNSNNCGNDQTSHMDEYYEIWTDKNYLYAHQYFSRGEACGSNRHYKSMDVYLKMTTETNYWCKFRLEGDYLCGQTWNTKCAFMKSHAANFVNTINDRLQNEYRPQFYAKFIENLEKYKNDLNNVQQMSCSSANFVYEEHQMVDDLNSYNLLDTAFDRKNEYQIYLFVGLIVFLVLFGSCIICMVIIRNKNIRRKYDIVASDINADI